MLSMKEILSRCDHTVLRQDARWEEIRQACEDAVTFGCASVCIPPSYVARAAAYAAGRVPVCTVIGFPNGYAATAVKVFEATEAVRSGADELDMVINLGWVKDGDWDGVTEEIRAVRAACPGRVLKVIVEACLLTEEEKERVSVCVTEAGADYIKTSTGFAGGGAELEDVALFAACTGPSVKVKAAGGIRTVDKAEAMIEAGADRIGTSALIKVARREMAHHGNLE